MDDVGLCDALLLQEVDEHILEACEAVLADFSSNSFSNSRELSGIENSGAATLPAWKAFLVDLRAIAFYAGYLCFFILVLVWDNNVTVGLCVRRHCLHLDPLRISLGSEAIVSSIGCVGTSLSS